MDLDRFRQCAEAFGAARRRWPERERPLYDRLAPTQEGAAILAEAERVDAFLDAYALETPRATAARPAWRRYLLPATVLAAAAALGFSIGFNQAYTGDADFIARLLLGPQSEQEVEL